MALADQEMRAAIAVTRFGLGVLLGVLVVVCCVLLGFLKSQIRKTGADQPLGQAASTGQRMAEFRDFRKERREERIEKAADTRPAAGDPNMAAADRPKAAFDPVKQVGNILRKDIADDFAARAALATTTDAAFRERWALFWANHFTVSATKAITGTVVGPFEGEAIRPHVFGRFGDLLDAVETHPAMLTYLDQAQSVGPDSPAA